VRPPARRRPEPPPREDRGHLDPFAVEPALLRGGDLAWTVRTGTNDPGRLVLARRGGRPRTLDRDARAVAAEDGVTLRWTHDDEIRYRDLGRVPLRDGCPRRAAFAPVIATADMLVSVAEYDSAATEDEEYVTVVRACVRGTRRDRVIASLGATMYGPDLAAVAARRGWVVLSESASAKDGTGTYAAEWRTVHVDGRRGRTMSTGGGVDGPRAAQFTVTDAGVPARIHGDRVMSVDAAGRNVQLDRGAVADLGASGTSLTWTNAGVPRSATL
jgi:hypothetical protein